MVKFIFKSLFVMVIFCITFLPSLLVAIILIIFSMGKEMKDDFIQLTSDLSDESDSLFG
jgi:hypothetical protein